MERRFALLSFLASPNWATLPIRRCHRPFTDAEVLSRAKLFDNLKAK